MRTKGFTLLEALIAVLVVSLGLIGIGFLQLKSLQSASLSFHRTVATHAAQDALERLWSRLATNGGTCPAPIEVYEDWYQAWRTKLPGLVDDIAQIDNGSHGCEYQITVSWADDRFPGESDAARLVYRSRLPGNP